MLGRRDPDAFGSGGTVEVGAVHVLEQHAAVRAGAEQPWHHTWECAAGPGQDRRLVGEEPGNLLEPHGRPAATQPPDRREVPGTLLLGDEAAAELTPHPRERRRRTTEAGVRRPERLVGCGQSPALGFDRTQGRHPRPGLGLGQIGHRSAVRSRTVGREQPQHADLDAVPLLGTGHHLGDLLPVGQLDLERRQRAEHRPGRVNEDDGHGTGHGGHLTSREGQCLGARRTSATAVTATDARTRC